MNKLILLLILLFSSNSFAVEPITNQNWKNHSEIIKIRKLCEEIEKLDKDGKLTFEWKECDVTEIHSIWIDANGVIRKYRITGGAESGDTFFQSENYYNRSGILRFMYSEHNTVRGAASNFRIYFDEKGKKIFVKQSEQGKFDPANEIPEEINDPKEYYKKFCKEE